MGTPTRLVDSFGRRHDNLRISVTDRCNIRCFFCMPEDDPVFVQKSEILTFEEIERFVRVAARLGIRKLRLTGGEPLVRRDLHVLVRKLAAVPGISDLALTTNGLLLADRAAPLREAGLGRVTVHLDTLDPAKFRQITRRDGLERVLEGIFACRRLGYPSVKLNAVAVRGLSEDDLVPLARFGREHGIEVRFIEYMPLDADGKWRRDSVLLAADILDILSREVAPLIPALDQDARAPAARFVFSDGVGGVGIIASVSRPFCGSCNRLRLTADGKLRYCLFALEETDVKGPLRSGGTDEELERLIEGCVGAKWEGHEINTARFVQPPRPMYAIGG
ncbi:MAG: GTP 3',8-cyclase MoaA [Planctomycetes bacterium]|nr:GTP 3',8-cyclase MoaA [Planctomycetota bacterium]